MRHSLSITVARSPLRTIAKRVASDTATSETSIPNSEVGEAWRQMEGVKEAATHLVSRMHRGAMCCFKASSSSGSVS